MSPFSLPFRKRRRDATQKSHGRTINSDGERISSSLPKGGMTAKESSQSQRSGSSRALEETTSAVHHPATAALTDSLTSTSSLLQSGNLEAEANDPRSPPESLWEQAYKRLKVKECKLVDDYEKILSRELEKGNQLVKQAAADGKARRPGAQKIKREEKVKQIVGLALNGVLSLEDVVNLALQALPQTAIAWTGVCFALHMFINPQTEAEVNRKGIIYVISRMDWYSEWSNLLEDDHRVSLGLRDELKKCVLNIYEALLSYLLKRVCSYYKSRFTNFLRDMVKLNDWGGDVQAIQDAEKVLQQDSNAYDNVQIKSHLKRLADVESKGMKALHDICRVLQKQATREMTEREQQSLWGLYLIDPRDEIARIEDRKDHLCKDSFTWILGCDEYKKFLSWDDNNKHRLLWIKGDAGKGKTMLLIGVIRELERLDFHRNPPNLSYFFFQGTDSKLNTPTAVLRCLVWLLVVQQPSLISYVNERYTMAGPDVFTGERAFYTLENIFKGMLKDSLLERAIFIVDALDECIDDDDKPGLPRLLDLIATTVATCSNTKWLVSSRNRSIIASRLGAKEDKRLDLELNSECIRNAVATYIDYKLSTLNDRKQYEEDDRAEIAQVLRDKADGTFLWVALVCKELEFTPSYCAIDVVRKTPSKLKDLYGHMMRQIKNEKSDEPKYCKDLLSTMILVYQPLHLSELAILSNLPRRVPVEEMIKKCASFLTVRNDIVYFVHQSANDYLTEDAELLSDGPASGHVAILSNSMKAMSDKLGKNIYGIKDPDCSIVDVTRPNPDPLISIRYACHYWIDHLADPEGNLYDPDVLSTIRTFLETHLLQWLEALTLMKNISRAIVTMRNLGSILAQAMNVRLDFLSFVRDVNRFILHNRYCIVTWPLQIYASAICFCPTESPIRRLFWDDEKPAQIRRIESIDKNWSPCLQTLVGHTDAVVSVMFSSDGLRLASGSWDKTARIWDAETGEILQILKHTNSVRSVTFLQYRRQLATASSTAISIWDTETGVLQRTLDHTAQVTSLAFSQVEYRLGSGLTDGTVWIWDVRTGMLQRKLKCGIRKNGLDKIMTVAFSQDGQRLVCVDHDYAVWVWNLEMEVTLWTLQGMGLPSIAGPQGSSSFSSCHGLVFRHRFGRSEMWNTETRALQWSLSMEPTANASAFSSDGRWLAATVDEKVQIQEAATGRVVQVFRGHTRDVVSIAFSDQGRWLVSASIDDTVRIWDAQAEVQVAPEGHTEMVRAIAFSHDRQLLATGSDDMTVQIWNTESGELQLHLILDGGASSITSVAFSPDGQRVASSSYDDSTRIWDVKTGKLQFTMPGHWCVGGSPECAHQVAFSHDGRLLASTCSSPEIQLWNAETGNLKLIVNLSDRQRASSVGFSHDDQRLVAGSYSNVYIWDAKTGRLQHLLKGLRDSVNALEFSSDGRYLAGSCSYRIESASGMPIRESSGGRSRLGELAQHYHLVPTTAILSQGTAASL